MLFLPIALCAALTTTAAQAPSCPQQSIEALRLPDMNTARASHCAFIVGDEMVVVGGHTAGFVPTATAEYYKDGRWHQIPTVYAHDNGFGLMLKSGQLLIGGGHSEALGIGQTFPVERYDAIEHRFEGFGCLDSKRALASATEIDSGRVVIVGNWYGKDNIEMYDGVKSFHYIKDVSAARPTPYVLRTGNDVIIFGQAQHDGHTFACDTVDRLYGESFVEPLLQTRAPVLCDIPIYSDNLCISDGADGGSRAYLILAHDKDSVPGLLTVSGTHFELLPTACPMPTAGQHGSILYATPPVVDRERQRAYIIGRDADQRVYVLAVDYALSPAGLTLYCTEPLPDCGNSIPLLTAEGHLIVAGGITNDNFSPLKSVFLLPVGKGGVDSAAQMLLAAKEPPRCGTSLFMLWPMAVLLIIIVLFLIVIRKKKNAKKAGFNETDSSDDTDSSYDSSALRQRIEQVMRDEQMFLNPQLKLSDLVALLNTNRNYVYQALNVDMGMSFTEYVNRLRVDYAEQLLASEPTLGMNDVAHRSGFASTVSFYRNFKAFRGCTPKKFIAASAGSAESKPE